MNVLVLGGSQNIGYHAALRFLSAARATVTYLLRRTSVFDDDEQVQIYVKSGKARLVSGDALKAEDVSKAWQTALDAGQGKVDYALFTIGGKPSLSLSKGMVLDPPDICTHCLLNLLSTTPASLRAAENQPHFVAVTSSGITTEAYAKLPFALKALYAFVLPAALADKLGMERVLAHAAGLEWSTRDEVSATVLPEGWESTPGLLGAAELKHVVIVRPAVLTDGPCRGDETVETRKGIAPYRTLANDELGDGYRVSRQDVAHFIVQDVASNWSKWQGAAVNIAY